MVCCPDRTVSVELYAYIEPLLSVGVVMDLMY